MNERIIPKSGLLALMPFPKNTAQAFAGRIFVPKDFYAEYCSGTLSPQRASVIDHEAKHLQRQQEVGIIRWLLTFLLSPQFRYQEELLAVKAQIDSLINQSAAVPIETYAANLSSWLYAKMVSYEQAFNDLSTYYKDANSG